MAGGLDATGLLQSLPWSTSSCQSGGGSGSPGWMADMTQVELHWWSPCPLQLLVKTVLPPSQAVLCPHDTFTVFAHPECTVPTTICGRTAVVHQDLEVLAWAELPLARLGTRATERGSHFPWQFTSPPPPRPYFCGSVSQCNVGQRGASQGAGDTVLGFVSMVGLNCYVL